MGDYFQHWLDVGERLPHAPPIFCVNWFRRDEQDRFIWPGYGDNMRALAWIVDRAHGRAKGRESILGWAPTWDDIRQDGLTLSRETFAALTELDRDAWLRELDAHAAWFAQIGERLPATLALEWERLAKAWGR